MTGWTAKEPRTIKGYISLIKKIELIDPSSLKGFDKLSLEYQEILSFLSVDISNYINEIGEK